MRRVLLVVRPAAGGIRSHVLGLLEWADGVTFEVAAPAAFLHALPADISTFTINIAPRLSLFADLRAARRLRFLSREFDTLHAHGLRAGWIAALAGVPFLLTAHNLVENTLLTRFALRVMARRAMKIVAVSRAVADTLIDNGVPPAKVVVIPNGVDCARFARQTLPEWGVGGLVLCVARLSPEKGVDVFLEAARLCPDMTFTVAGDGPQRQELERAAPPNVTFAGRVPDTRPLLWNAGVLVVPSRSEGQGIVALEAMAAGVPVVASRVGGLPDMVRDGKTGLLFPPGDAAALAAALRRLHSDPALRGQLTANALELVRERFDVRRTVAAVVDEYKATASRAAARA